MKHLIIIAALIASAPAHAERFGFGIDPHSVGGWGQQTDSYTPSNPSPSRGGTYDGDDGYTQPSGLGWSAPATPPANFRNFARDLFRGCKWCK